MLINKTLDAELIIRIDKHSLDQLSTIAAQLDTSIGEIVREAIKQFVCNIDNTLEQQQKNPRSDAIFNCHEILEKILPNVTNWQDLNEQMQLYGIEYFERGGGLALRWTTDKRYICKASEVGPGYSQLVKKFKSAFPNHSSQWIADRLLKSTKKDQ